MVMLGALLGGDHKRDAWRDFQRAPTGNGNRAPPAGVGHEASTVSPCARKRHEEVTGLHVA